LIAIKRKLKYFKMRKGLLKAPSIYETGLPSSTCPSNRWIGSVSESYDLSQSSLRDEVSR